jgi:hypothetical protein
VDMRESSSEAGSGRSTEQSQRLSESCGSTEQFRS